MGKELTISWVDINLKLEKAIGPKQTSIDLTSKSTTKHDLRPAQFHLYCQMDVFESFFWQINV
jgi:hypothetical protein